MPPEWNSRHASWVNPSMPLVAMPAGPAVEVIVRGEVTLRSALRSVVTSSHTRVLHIDCAVETGPGAL